MPYQAPDPAPAPVPLYGDALEDVFSTVIQGILGFADGSLIRPRWQPEPPNTPPFSTDWVAFGINSLRGDWNPYQSQLDAAAGGGQGANIFERDEELVLLHSFYGPNGMALLSRYQDGLLVDDNRALLTANGIKFVECGEAYHVPALLKEKWVKKVDLRVTFRRRIRRTYSIRYLLSAEINLDNEQYLTQITVTQ
jgi:hypothetical protein